MNCREFIIEFEERGVLSEIAQLHLTACTDCKKTSERQKQLWLMIDDFQPVAAPTDFDFHVKARIARAKPSDFQKPAFLPILRYVLPLSVVVLLLGIFVFNLGIFSAATNDSPIAQVETITPTIKNELPLNVSLANQLAFAPSESNKTVAAPKVIGEGSLVPQDIPQSSKNDRNTKIETADLLFNKSPKSKYKDEQGGGSRVSALTPVIPVLPVGINLNGNTANAPKIEAPKSLSDEQRLDFLGIKTAVENGKRMVKSLEKDKSGEISGVKVGDVIEKVSGNTLTIQRGTENLEITLRLN